LRFGVPTAPPSLDPDTPDAASSLPEPEAGGIALPESIFVDLWWDSPKKKKKSRSKKSTDPAASNARAAVGFRSSR
jgi:hypothetical protein